MIWGKQALIIRLECPLVSPVVESPIPVLIPFLSSNRQFLF